MCFAFEGLKISFVYFNINYWRTVNWTAYLRSSHLQNGQADTVELEQEESEFLQLVRNDMDSRKSTNFGYIGPYNQSHANQRNGISSDGLKTCDLRTSRFDSIVLRPFMDSS